MRPISSALLLAVLLGCESEPRDTQPLASRIAGSSTAQYDIVLLPTLGGRLTRPTGINNGGLIAGFANLPGNATRHAAVWRNGAIADLGTLGGPHSSVQWPGLNDHGTIVGIAETNEPDPLHEAWSCTAFFPNVTGKICLGFVWDGDAMTPLLTLGGHQSFAAGVNNRGEVVGWAETPAHDPTCNAPQVLQFRAVLWEPREDRWRELPPLPGDSASAATAINDRGQAVGISGECDVAVGQRSARHSVLWDHGEVSEIGDLGGDMWHTPMDISERGDVVGFSNPASVLGTDFAPHAFLWTHQDGIRNLGAVGDDTTSQALGINERRQVVGSSSGTGGARAFLWQDGVMRDLNELVAPDYPHHLLVAQHINDRGVIVGRVVLQGTTTQVPFVLTPRP